MASASSAAELSIRLCDASYCIERVTLPRLYCEAHWSFIPRKLQNEIAETWSWRRSKLEVVLKRARVAINDAERVLT